MYHLHWLVSVSSKVCIIVPAVLLEGNLGHQITLLYYY